MEDYEGIMMNCAGIMISPSERVKRIVSSSGMFNDSANSNTKIHSN